MVGITTEEFEVELEDTDGEWLEKAEFISVTKKHIARKLLPDNAMGVFWTRSGQENGAIKVTKPTYVKSGTNVGKKNYTTAFTAALRKVMTKYNDKIKDGMTPNKESLKPRNYRYSFDELLADKNRGITPWRVFPMAFHSWDDEKSREKIKFPAYIQPKYDGTRLLVVYSSRIPGEIDSYSRGRETFIGQEHILDELKSMLKDYPALYLDGELWKKGYGLQDISGSSRRLKEGESSIKLEYHVFDAFYLDKNESFKERNERLEEMFKDRKFKFVFKVPTQLANTKEEALSTYEKFIAPGTHLGTEFQDGLEGAIVRNVNSPYEVGFNKEERTYKSLKIKPRNDADYPVVGFTDGDGKNKNLVIWRCKGPTNEFNVTPNWPELKRAKVFKLLNDSKNSSDSFFEKHVKNQLAVVQYSILSNDKMPQQPKFLRFKETKIDELINSSIN